MKLSMIMELTRREIDIKEFGEVLDVKKCGKVEDWAPGTALLLFVNIISTSRLNLDLLTVQAENYT